MQLYETIAQQLGAREAPPLAPQNNWNESVSEQLQSDDETLFGAEIARAFAAADKAASTRRALCRAALFLWNDDVHAAHKIVQPLENNATANAIHAIVHRREGDFSNALGWWRKTGTHPLLHEIGVAAHVLNGAREYSQLFGMGDVFDAAAFVKLCDNAAPNNEDFLRRIQAIELEKTYEFCRAQMA